MKMEVTVRYQVEVPDSDLRAAYMTADREEARAVEESLLQDADYLLSQVADVEEPEVSVEIVDEKPAEKEPEDESQELLVYSPRHSSMVDHVVGVLVDEDSQELWRAAAATEEGLLHALTVGTSERVEYLTSRYPDGYTLRVVNEPKPATVLPAL